MEILDFKYINQDALQFMKSIPDGSVNLIVTSPPYNIGKEYESTTSLNKYLEGIKPILKESCRILASNGSICWEVGNYIDPKSKEVYPLDIYFYNIFKELGLHLRNRIIWHFGHGSTV